MKILLTGLPKSGKTTLLNRLVADLSDKQGMVATEVRQDDQRVGFDLQDATGRTCSFARTQPKTEAAVGRYFVDVPALEQLVQPLFTYQPLTLLYIDEIGRMQLYSDKFQELVSAYLAAPNEYIGTISSVYDHSFIAAVLRRPDVLVCTVTPVNRDELYIALQAWLAHRTALAQLSDSMQRRVLILAKKYAVDGAYISLKKLFANAVEYVANAKVVQVSPLQFTVAGNHGHYTVQRKGDDYGCDCDFFNGRGAYRGKAGECSHIQAVKLSIDEPVIPRGQIAP